MGDERMDPDATERVPGAPGGSPSASRASRRSGSSDPDATQRVWSPDGEMPRAAGQVVFGRYKLEAEVGRGGMGVVWRAHDNKLNETVALKFLPPAVARDAVALDELKEETRRARRLRHANIVGVFDLVEDATGSAIAMEFVDGTTLAQLRLQQPGKVFSTEKLAPIVAQICSALDYAHTQARLVHRDLKPANILVAADGTVKVADFGIARSLSETHTRLTGKSAGNTSGTLPYMSPQQLAGKKPSAGDDIYALGATLYELLTSKPPFFRGELATLMRQIETQPPLPLAEQRAELEVTGEPIPLAWSEAVLACIAKEPASRPTSAGDVAVALRKTSLPLSSRSRRQNAQRWSDCEARVDSPRDLSTLSQIATSDLYEPERGSTTRFSRFSQFTNAQFATTAPAVSRLRRLRDMPLKVLWSATGWMALCVAAPVVYMMSLTMPELQRASMLGRFWIWLCFSFVSSILGLVPVALWHWLLMRLGLRTRWQYILGFVILGILLGIVGAVMNAGDQGERLPVEAGLGFLVPGGVIGGVGAGWWLFRRWISADGVVNNN